MPPPVLIELRVLKTQRFYETVVIISDEYYSRGTRRLIDYFPNPTHGRDLETSGNTTHGLLTPNFSWVLAGGHGAGSN